MTAPDWSASIEAAARAWAETTGEVTTYNETACADHTRWSWEGDGHSEEFKTINFRDPARAALSAALPLLAEVFATAIEAEIWTDPDGETKAWRSGKNAGLADAAELVRELGKASE